MRTARIDIAVSSASPMFSVHTPAHSRVKKTATRERRAHLQRGRSESCSRAPQPVTRTIMNKPTVHALQMHRTSAGVRNDCDTSTGPNISSYGGKARELASLLLKQRGPPAPAARLTARRSQASAGSSTPARSGHVSASETRPRTAYLWARRLVHGRALRAADLHVRVDARPLHRVHERPHVHTPTRATHYHHIVATASIGSSLVEAVADSDGRHPRADLRMGWGARPKARSAAEAPSRETFLRPTPAPEAACPRSTPGPG